MLPKVPIGGIITFVLGVKSDLPPEILKLPEVRYITYFNLPNTTSRWLLESNFVVVCSILVDSECTEEAKATLIKKGVPLEKIYNTSSKLEIEKWLLPRHLRPPAKPLQLPAVRPQAITITELIKEVEKLQNQIQKLRASNLALYKEVMVLKKQDLETQLTA